MCERCERCEKCNGCNECDQCEECLRFSTCRTDCTLRTFRTDVLPPANGLHDLRYFRPFRGIGRQL